MKTVLYIMFVLNVVCVPLNLYCFFVLGGLINLPVGAFNLVVVACYVYSAYKELA